MRLGYFMERIIKAIKAWWHGKEVDEKQGQYDAVSFAYPLSRRHWTSKWAHKFFDFYLKNWKYIWELVVIVLTAILVAKFFD